MGTEGHATFFLFVFSFSDMILSFMNGAHMESQCPLHVILLLFVFCVRKLIPRITGAIVIVFILAMASHPTLEFLVKNTQFEKIFAAFRKARAAARLHSRSRDKSKHKACRSIKFPKCVRCCPMFYTMHTDFRKHLKEKHSNEYADMLKKVNPPEVLNFPIDDLDIIEDDNHGIDDEFDLDLEDQDDFYTNLEQEVVKVSTENFSNFYVKKFKRSIFFNDFYSQFNGEARKKGEGHFDDIVYDRFFRNLPFAAISSTSQAHLARFHRDNPELPDRKVYEFAREFAASKKCQEIYVQRNGTYIKPEEFKIGEHTVGFKVSLMSLALLILQNVSIVNSILHEEKHREKCENFTIFNSELTCNPKRRERLLGRLRFEIGADDFSLELRGSAHKYYAVYVSFTNIPPKSRLKRGTIYLWAIIWRPKLKEIGASIDDVFSHLRDEMRILSETGVNINCINKDNQLVKKNIKCALSGICGDNLGVYELLGLRLCWSKDECICRYCGTKLCDLKNYHDKPPLLGGDNLESDLREYEQYVKAAGEHVAAGKPIKSYRNRFNVIRPCALLSLPGIDLWSVSPPDVLHDLSEGVVDKLLKLLIMKYALKGLRKAQVLNIVNKFKFSNGKFKMRIDKGEFEFSSAKAVQV